MKLIKLFILLTFVVLNVGIAGAQRDKIITVGGVSFKMIYVQGGTFQQYSGCTLPSSQTVSVGSFYIGETEVTQGLIKAVYGVYY